MCAAIQELHSDCEIHFSKHNKHFYFRSLCVHKLHLLLLHKKTANANTSARMEIFTVTMCSLSLISSSLLFLSNLIFYDNDSELSWCVVRPTCDATGRSNQHPNSDWVMKTFAAMLSLIRHVTGAGELADESCERWQKSSNFRASDDPPTSDQLRRWFVDITFLSACASKSTTIVNGFIDKFSSFLCCFPQTLVKHSPDCLLATFRQSAWSRWASRRCVHPRAHHQKTKKTRIVCTIFPLTPTRPTRFQNETLASDTATTLRLCM